MKAKVLILGLLLAIALVGCSVNPQVGTSPGAPAAKGPSGTVTLTLPRISSYLASALGVPPATVFSTGRAVLIIDRVELTLWLSGETIDTLEVMPGSGPNMGQPIEWSVPSAAGYTVTARIFNNNVDVSTPVLYGVSDPFDVTAGGSTDVIIRPVPNPPTTLTPVAVPVSGVATGQLTSCYVTGPVEAPVYSWGGERWFSIDTSQSAIRVNADPDASSGVYMVVADQAGMVRGMALSGAIGGGGPAYWNWGGVATLGALTGGSRCYVGLITLSSTGSAITSTVDVSFTPFADDAYEPNNTIETAAFVPKTTVVNGVDLDNFNTYNWPGTGGDWYKFTLTGTDDPNVTIVLEFDMDVSDLAMRLLSWDGMNWMQITEANSSVLSGPANPAAKEEERITRSLAPGEYYIWVLGYTPFPCGNSYRLQWVAGNGTINIGLQ